MEGAALNIEYEISISFLELKYVSDRRNTYEAHRHISCTCLLLYKYFYLRQKELVRSCADLSINSFSDPCIKRLFWQNSVSLLYPKYYEPNKPIKNCGALVRQWNIPTERPPLVGEVRDLCTHKHWSRLGVWKLTSSIATIVYVLVLLSWANIYNIKYGLWKARVL
jgi:hypothetical protein